MRLDSLVRLIEAADFMSFRELALHCLALKGYRGVTVTDGWNDGGTDVRVFQLPPNPSGIAFQITVERDWKGKLHDDAAKVKEAASRGAKVWDQIAVLERGALSDAGP